MIKLGHEFEVTDHNQCFSIRILWIYERFMIGDLDSLDEQIGFLRLMAFTTYSWRKLPKNTKPILW